MRFSESEIVEDILEHIRQAGGEFSEWHVGTARGIQGGRFKMQDESANGMPKLAHNEAFTAGAARSG